MRARGSSSCCRKPSSVFDDHPAAVSAISASAGMADPVLSEPPGEPQGVALHAQHDHLARVWKDAAEGGDVDLVGDQQQGRAGLGVRGDQAAHGGDLVGLGAAVGEE